MKTSSVIVKRGVRTCPACGDAVARDLANRGFCRHKTNSNCNHEKGSKDR